jgi:dsDNA-binding SOS-regulon protein
VTVAALLQEKLQQSAVQLDTLQQEVQQLSVAQVRTWCTSSLCLVQPLW